MSLAARGWCVVLSLLWGCSGFDSTEHATREQRHLLEATPIPSVSASATPPGFPLAVPQTLVKDVEVSSIVLDATNVYFAGSPHGGIEALIAGVPLAGGGMTTFLREITIPRSLLLLRGTLFWVGYGGPGNGIWGAATDQSAPAFQIASVGGPYVVSRQALAVFETGATVLTRTTHLIYGDTFGYSLLDERVSLSGTTEVSLLESEHWGPYQVDAVAVDSSYIYFTGYGFDLGHTFHGLARLPRGGGDVTWLTERAEPEQLVITGGQLYFLDDGDIKTMPAGGGAITTFANNVGKVVSMVAANDNLYWACSSCKAIYKKPLAGGSKAAVVIGESDLLSLAVNATHVYWGTSTALKRLRN